MERKGGRAESKRSQIDDRFDGRMSRAVETATETGKASSKVLVGIEGVPANKSFQVFKKCATLAGVEVVGSWDRRSVPRIMHETLFVGLSLSGDGASHNNIQFSARHATTVPTDFARHPVDLFIGVHPEINHMTTTQADGWKEMIGKFCMAWRSRF